MLTKGLILSIIFFFTSVFSLAQDKDTVIVEDEEGVKDTVVLEDDDWDDDEWGKDWEEDWHNDWDHFEWDEFINDFRGKPALSLNYGLSTLDLSSFTSDFARPGLIEGKLGYVTERSDFDKEYIAKNSYKFVRLSNVSTNLTQKDIAATEIQSNMWRFGFGREAGYGWKFGESAIIPYNSNSFDWSRVDINDFPPDSSSIGDEPGQIPEQDVNTLSRYNESFRFGSSTEGGIKFRIISGITIDAAYERAIIFERHLFWKWAGSGIIEIAAHGLLDAFIDEVGEASPDALPIVNFVLKNALSYGLYELRTEKMNWPFPSAAPLNYDQFKFGLTFVF